MKKQTWIIVVLAVLLVIALGIIAVTQIRAYNIDKRITEQQEKQAIYNQGATDGYAAAIQQLMQEASTCNAVPVYSENVTMNLVATECLQQAQQ